MRLLVDRNGREPGDLTEKQLAALYAVPSESWFRANMVTTLDGAASGSDGRTGSINNLVDRRVFHLLRAQSDAVVVGAGTARAEAYGPSIRPLVVVSRLGALPRDLADVPSGSVLMATCLSAPNFLATERVLGTKNVIVLGETSVDLTQLRPQLAARGMLNLLCEGGPTLLNQLLQHGAIDELCLTQVPEVVGGRQSRITFGPAAPHTCELTTLIEADGTLLARWFVNPNGAEAPSASSVSEA